MIDLETITNDINNLQKTIFDLEFEQMDKQANIDNLTSEYLQIGEQKSSLMNDLDKLLIIKKYLQDNQ